ncbi:MAG: type II toxin-antitoxin system HicB family antitoxin [Lachnospiraceae bacterium]|nr:type II toxin-antitoxin system HicB family antitoxin [Lachnospiraceae bacterium]
MQEAYPVFIKQYKKEYLVYVPDMGIYTEGKSIADAMAMARDAIGLKGIDLEDEKFMLPIPSDEKRARAKVLSDADDTFDYSDGYYTLVDVDFTEYRRKMDNRAVKKNCTIPYRLCMQAEKAGVNFSKLLQEALQQYLAKIRE